MTKDIDHCHKCSRKLIISGPWRMLGHYKIPPNISAPMLVDKVWNEIAGSEDILCYDCTEEALERELVFSDLRPCVMNLFGGLPDDFPDDEDELPLLWRYMIAAVKHPDFETGSPVWLGKGFYVDFRGQVTRVGD